MLLLKSPELTLELVKSLPITHRLLIEVTEFVEKRFKKNITLAEIFKSQKEQSVSIRTRGLTKEEVRAILAFIQIKFSYLTNPPKPKLKSKGYIYIQVHKTLGDIE